MTQLEIHYCQTCARYDAAVDGCNGMGIHPKPCDMWTMVGTVITTPFETLRFNERGMLIREPFKDYHQRVEAWNRKAVNHD